MTYTTKQIMDRYLFSFCNPGNGVVLVCKIEIEKGYSFYKNRSYMHFVSCTDDSEGYDFVDNIFYSEDGENWTPNDGNKEWMPLHSERMSYVENFVQKIFNTQDSFVERVIS